MSGFIAWLEKLNESDSKVRAILRRSLAFDAGIDPEAGRHAHGGEGAAYRL